MFYEKQSKTTGKFIVYSTYGWQSHIVMNNYGVMFSCNPQRTPDTDRNAVVYESEQAAKAAKDDFYNQVAEVQLITRYEADYTKTY